MSAVVKLTPIGTMSTLSQLCAALPMAAPAMRPAAVIPPARAAVNVGFRNTDILGVQESERAVQESKRAMQESERAIEL